MMQPKTEQKLSKPLSKRGSKLAKKKPSPKASSRQISEKEIHMKAWQWVKTYYPDLLIFHVPSGEPRDVTVAMKLKRMGVVPGVADFLMFIPGHSIAIELKDDGGRQSDPQKLFQKKWEACGFRYKIARSLEEFQGIVRKHYWPSFMEPKL
jgi:hypothetical protein